MMTLSGIPPDDKISQVTQICGHSMTSKEVKRKEMGGLFDAMFVTDEVKNRYTHIYAV